MKRNRIGRAALATMMSMALGLGLTACSRDYTVAYVYAVSAQTAAVSAFDVDYQSGSLVQIAGSPFASNLHNPVSVITTPNSKNLYVIGGSQDNAISWMAIGTDGKLYGQKQYNITGSIPTGAAIDPSGSFLFVTYKLQNIYTTVSPGPGGVSIFPINADGSLGTAVNQNLGNNPVGVAVGGLQACNTSTATGGNCPTLPTANCQSIAASAKVPALCHYVYILDADTSSTGVGLGQILGFVNTGADGSLTPVPGTTITTVSGKTVGTGFNAGTNPTAIAADPTSKYVYITDRATNQMLGYQVQGQTAPGSLIALKSNPFITGQFPVAITIDPRGKFMYVANFGASTVSSYAIDPATGNPSGVAGTGNATVNGTGPTCLTIEPALGIYLYTSNQISASVSGQQLDPHTGALKGIENSPFDAGPLLSCAASAANGEHATSIVTP
jgi:6-phosphogluconolactonase